MVERTGRGEGTRVGELDFSEEEKGEEGLVKIWRVVRRGTSNIALFIFFFFFLSFLKIEPDNRIALFRDTECNTSHVCLLFETNDFIREIFP